MKLLAKVVLVVDLLVNDFPFGDWLIGWFISWLVDWLIGLVGGELVE